MFRPTFELPYERGDADIFGTVLRALMVGWRMLPGGGRGTLWFIAICGALRFAAVVGRFAPRLAIAVLELPRLCGGRGTLRPAGCAIDLALFDCARFEDDVEVLRAIAVPLLREEATAGEGLDEVLGGVIRLTVGREAIAADGCAAGKPAFGPSILVRVGARFGLLTLAFDKLRNALGGTLTLFPATGKPRCNVFRETAVSAPGLPA